MINMESFKEIQLAVGTVTDATINDKAKIPAYCLTIDFGPQGIKQSSAQLTENYDIADMLNRQIVGVINLPPKRVAGFRSEVLVLGAVNASTGTVLISPLTNVPNGTLID